MTVSVKCPRCGHVDSFIKGYLPETCVCRVCQSQLDWREIPGCGPDCRRDWSAGEDRRSAEASGRPRGGRRGTGCLSSTSSWVSPAGSTSASARSRAGSPPRGAGRLLAHVERALRLQALQAAAEALPHQGRSACCRARARTPASWTSAAGVAVAMKIESHNHPSAVEPYQGAATGVGGIIRDIFAMGARPICGLDSLRFGEISRLPGAGRPGESPGRSRRRPPRPTWPRRSGRSTASATCSSRWWPASAATATAWASPPWPARSTSRIPTPATAW